MTGYNHRYEPNNASITKPLTLLKKKNRSGSEAHLNRALLTYSSGYWSMLQSWDTLTQHSRIHWIQRIATSELECVVSGHKRIGVNYLAVRQFLQKSVITVSLDGSFWQWFWQLNISGLSCMAKGLPFKLTVPLLFGSIEEKSPPAKQIISVRLCSERKRNREMPIILVVGHVKTVDSVCQLEGGMEIQPDWGYMKNYRKKQRTIY